MRPPTAKRGVSRKSSAIPPQRDGQAQGLGRRLAGSWQPLNRPTGRVGEGFGERAGVLLFQPQLPAALVLTPSSLQRTSLQVDKAPALTDRTFQSRSQRWRAGPRDGQQGGGTRNSLPASPKPLCDTVQGPPSFLQPCNRASHPGPEAQRHRLAEHAPFLLRKSPTQ